MLPSLKARRRLWLEIHLWLGLALGFFLAVFGLSGSLLVFHEEIDQWLNPDLYFSSHAGEGEARPAGELLAEALRHAPSGWSSWVLQVPERADGNYLFTFWSPQPLTDPEAAVSLNVAVDPFTGKLARKRVFYHAWNPLKHCFIGFFFKLHYALLLGDYGGVAVGIMAVLLVISALTGLILWWPLDGKWQRVLTVKTSASRIRLNHDLHQAGGFYLLPVLLVVLVSGLYFNLPEQFRWVVERFSSVRDEPASRNGTAPMLDLDSQLERLRQQEPGGRLAVIEIPDAAKGTLLACYRQVPELAQNLIDQRCLYVDRHDGSVLQVRDTFEGSAGDAFMLWQWPLHSGKAFGWTGRILVFLCGLLCPLLFATGLIRWWQKQRARAVSEARKTAGQKEGPQAREGAD